MTKKIVSISLFISWTILVIFITAGLFSFGNKPNQSSSGVQPNKTTPVSSSTATAGNTSIKSYSLNEIAKHNNQNDCWMAIGGKVYDVTSFIGSHPGGERAILSGCGKDATNAFDSRHSQAAFDLLPQFFIGNLNS